MSDAAKNVEIEDVLASIRRLVSDEPAPDAELVPEAGDTPTSGSVTPAEESRDAEQNSALVLTPALRVDRPGPSEADSAARTLAPGEDRDAEVRPAEPAATHVTEKHNADAPDDAQGPDPDLDASQVGAISTTNRRRADPVVLRLSPDSAPERVFEDISEDEVDARIARLQALVRRADVARAPADPDQRPGDPARGIPDLSECDQPEPLRLDAEMTPAEAPPKFDAQRTSGAHVDEDMLRDLVAVLVREELRGALGENVTRNLRKLVRREVQRALTDRDTR